VWICTVLQLVGVKNDNNDKEDKNKLSSASVTGKGEALCNEEDKAVVQNVGTMRHVIRIKRAREEYLTGIRQEDWQTRVGLLIIGC